MTITRVQGNQVNSATGSVTSQVVTLSAGLTLGNLVVAALSSGNDTVIFTPPDGSWTQAVFNQPAGTNANEVVLYYLIVDSGHVGQTSWTWTLNGSHSAFICLEEWHSSTGWPASPLDKTATGDTVGTPVTATTITSGATATTTSASELWIAGLAYKGAAQTESSITAGWTKDLEATLTTNSTLTMLYQIAASTGAASCSYRIGTAAYWSGVVATFKPNVVASGYAAAVLADSPIRYYRLGEASGTVATDSGSQAQNGTYIGGYTLGQSSLLTSDPDKSVLFNGTTGGVSLPTTGLPTGAQPYSIECWCKPTDTLTTYALGAFGTLLANEIAYLYYDGSFNLSNSNAGATASGYAPGSTWHVVATFDGTNGALYVNGALVQSVAFTGNNIVLGTAYIGLRDGPARYFKGSLDEFAIYTTALSAARILAHYNAGTVTATAAKKSLPARLRLTVSKRQSLNLRLLLAQPVVPPRTTIWPGIAINYGHHFGTSYNSTQVDSELTLLWNLGIRKVRIVFPDYDSTTFLANCQDMVTRALAKGFYVAWGVGTSGTVTATVWSAFKTAVTGTIAPWAKSVGLSELCIGNEVELNADETTLVDATAQADIRTMATTIKSGGFLGKVSYSTAATSSLVTAWNTGGLGSLDLIGWNSYDFLANFTIHAQNIVAAFGNKAYISEFGAVNNGYSDYNNESLYWTDVSGRISALISAGVTTGYFFTYRDGGGSGVPANSFGLVQTNNLPHLTSAAALGAASLPGYVLTVLGNTPVAYYRLDETTGTTAYDETANASNGQLHGTVTLSQAGLTESDPDTTMSFDGSTGYISIPTTRLPTGASPWSVECWVNLSVLSNTPHLFFIGSNVANEAIRLYYSTTSSKWAADLNGATVVTGTAASTNTTYHLVATYDGANLRLYVNGSLVGGPTAVTANVVMGSAYIGCFNAASNFATGRIDEAAVYPVALSAQQVRADYVAGLVHKSLPMRLRLGLVRSLAARVRLSIVQAVSLPARVRLAVQRSASTQIRVRLRQVPSLPARLRLAIATRRSLAARVRLSIGRFASLSMRVRLRNVRSLALRFLLRQVKSLPTRVRLAVGKSLSLVARLRLAVGKGISLAARVRLSIGKSVSLPSRLRLAVGKSLSVPARLRLVTGTAIIRSLAARVRLSIGKTASLAAHLRLSIGKTASLAARVRLSIQKSVSLPARVRLAIGKTISLAARLRLAVGKVASLPARIRLAIAMRRSLVARMRLSVGRVVSLPMRLRLLQVKSLVIRLRLLTVRSLPVRLRLRNVRSLVARVRVQVSRAVSTPMRLLLQTGTLAARSLVARIRLRVGSTRSLVARIRVRVARGLSVPARVRLSVGKVVSLPTRVRVRVATIRTLGSRLRLAIGKSVSLPTRVKLAVGMHRSLALRMRLLTVRSLLIRLRLLTVRSLSARVRLSIGKHASLPARLNLRSGTMRSLVARIRISIRHTASTPVRVRQSVGVHRALALRMRLRTVRSMSARIRLSVRRQPSVQMRMLLAIPVQQQYITVTGAGGQISTTGSGGQISTSGAGGTITVQGSAGRITVQGTSQEIEEGA